MQMRFTDPGLLYSLAINDRVANPSLPIFDDFDRDFAYQVETFSVKMMMPASTKFSATTRIISLHGWRMSLSILSTLALKGTRPMTGSVTTGMFDPLE